MRHGVAAPAAASAHAPPLLLPTNLRRHARGRPPARLLRLRRVVRHPPAQPPLGAGAHQRRHAEERGRQPQEQQLCRGRRSVGAGWAAPRGGTSVGGDGRGGGERSTHSTSTSLSSSSAYCTLAAGAGIERRFRSKLGDFRGSGYDRGHHAPAANHKGSQRAMDDTFTLTNASPQARRGDGMGSGGVLLQSSAPLGSAL